MTAEVRQDELKFCSPLREGWNPILAGAGKAMQQQEWLIGAVDFEVELLAIERFDSSGRTDRYVFSLLCIILWCKKKTARAFARAVRRSLLSLT